MARFITLLLLSCTWIAHPAYATSTSAPSDFHPYSLHTGYEDPIVIGFYSVEDSDVKSAFCKATEMPSQSEMESYIDSRKKAAVNDAFKDLKSPIYPLCKTALCSVQYVWGPSLGTKILYLKLKFEINASEYAFPNSDRFTEEELNDVMLAVQDLPPKFIPFANNKQLTHFTRGMTLKIYGEKPVVANAVTNIFDLWNDHTSFRRQQVVFHELSHNISNILKRLDETQDWAVASRWLSPIWGTKSQCTVSEYGATSLTEDFAETLVMYRYRPEALKKICQSKYDFIKDRVFDGHEFTSVSKCSGVSEDVIDAGAVKMATPILNSSFSWDKINELSRSQCYQYEALAKGNCLDDLLDRELKSLGAYTSLPANAFVRREILKRARDRLLVNPFANQIRSEFEVKRQEVQTKIAQEKKYEDLSIDETLTDPFQILMAWITDDVTPEHRKVQDFFIADKLKVSVDRTFDVVSQVALERALKLNPNFKFLNSKQISQFIAKVKARLEPFRPAMSGYVKGRRKLYAEKLEVQVVAGFNAKFKKLSLRDQKSILQSTPESYCNSLFPQTFEGYSAALIKWCVSQQSKVSERTLFDSQSGVLQEALQEMQSF